MSSTTLAAPRSPQTRSKGTNWEKWGWIYMRMSGVVLVVLIFGHLFMNLWQGQGVSAINFGFVAGKWAEPFWQWWDVAMLWLALIHGGNGMRTIVNDYARGRTARGVLKVAILASVAILIILGTLVVFTFDPCLGTPSSDSLIQLCAARG